MNFKIFVATISTLRSLGSYGPEALEMLHYQGSKRVRASLEQNMRSLMLTCFTALLYLPVESLEQQLAKQAPAVKCWIIGLCIPEPFSTEELHKRKPRIGENLQKARSPELMDEAAIRMKVWRISSLSSSRETCSM